MIAPLKNANKVTLLNTPNMPTVHGAVSRFLSPLIFEKLQISNVGGLAQKIPIKIETLGSIQPLSGRALIVKPEGQRSWQWYQIHTLTNVALKTNDRIKIAGKIYKIMQKWEYDRNSYFEFHVIEDFDNGDWV